MNLTKKQIDIIRKNTKKKLVGKQVSIYTTLGYFRPYNANWSYHAGWDYDGNLVVTMFGRVVG